MNTTVWVEAHWAPVFEEQEVAVPTGHHGLLGGTETRVEKRRVQTGYSDCVVDGARLRTDMQAAIDRLNADGFDVIAVTPVESGAYDSEYYMQGTAGYGYSYTQGVIIIARSAG